MIAPEDYRKIEMELRDLLNAGACLGDALRLMHHERHVGLMFLWPAIMTIRGVDKQEAMRIVAHETAPWRSDEK